MLRMSKALGALLLAGAAWNPTAALAQSIQILRQDRIITVTALGQVTTAPDEVVFSIGVVSDDRSAKTALAANATALAPVIDGLKLSGVEARDISTGNFSLTPAYDYGPDGKTAKFTGYHVVNNVQVKLHAADHLGELLDQIVAQGSYQVTGVSFGVTNTDELRDKARKAAVVNATHIAKAYAESAGVGLGTLLTISQPVIIRDVARQTISLSPRPKTQAQPPVEPGEQTLEAQVTMSWQMK